MHKYCNLVKPFLMVYTDRHIIDVLGPHPATTSDAEIMKREVNTSFKVMLLYWIGAFVIHYPLHQCGYRTYVPALLEEGETQLSTIDANKSRAVTICRWVVEVVNGKFKRDFKLLQQNYFNVASKSLMKDFEVL